MEPLARHERFRRMAAVGDQFMLVSHLTDVEVVQSDRIPRQVRSIVGVAKTLALRIEAEITKPLRLDAETLACATRDEGTFGAMAADGLGGPRGKSRTARWPISSQWTAGPLSREQEAARPVCRQIRTEVEPRRSVGTGQCLGRGYNSTGVRRCRQSI